MANHELDKKACRYFVCPNLSWIDEAAVDVYNFASERTNYQLAPAKDPKVAAEKVAKVARFIAVEFFKKTYHAPPYTSPKRVMMGCIYIASIHCKLHVSQQEVADALGVSGPSIRKHFQMIAKTLGIEVNHARREVWASFLDEAESEGCI